MAFLVLLDTLLDRGFDLLNIPIPGLEGVPFVNVYLSLMLIGVGLFLMRLVFHFSDLGESPKTSSTDKPKISEKRKGDEF